MSRNCHANVLIADPILEDNAFSLMARLTADGVAIVQANVSEISILIFDTENGQQVGDEITPAVNATIFDALQTDSRWTSDTTGYNFRHDFDETALPEGDKRYRVETRITPMSGGKYTFVAEIPTLPLYRS